MKTLYEIFMHEEAKKYLAEIGRRGGQKSKRKLTKAKGEPLIAAAPPGFEPCEGQARITPQKESEHYER